MSDWLTLDEAAGLVGRSRRTVVRWLAQHPEDFTVKDGGWSGSQRTQLVSRESLTTFAAKMGVLGEGETEQDAIETEQDTSAPPQDTSAPPQDTIETERDTSAPPQSAALDLGAVVERLLGRLEAVERVRDEQARALLEASSRLAAAEALAAGSERVLVEVRQTAAEQRERLRTLEAQHRDAMERLLALERMLGAAMAEIQRYRAMGPVARLLSRPSLPEPQSVPLLRSGDD